MMLNAVPLELRECHTTIIFVLEYRIDVVLQHIRINNLRKTVILYLSCPESHPTAEKKKKMYLIAIKQQ